MRRPKLLVIVCGAVAIACLIAGGYFLVERPNVVRVAIPADDHGDFDLLAAAGKVVRHGQHPIRFKLVTVATANEAAEALDGGTVDMAVVRTDGVMPAQGQTVVILHRDAAVLVAPPGSSLKEVGDLADHAIGVVGGNPDDIRLLTTALARYDVAPGAVRVLPVREEDLAEAFKAKRIDAVLVVGIIAEPSLHRILDVVDRLGDGPPVFIAIPEADAIAQQSPAYEKFEVAKGAFHGAPPQPFEEFDTLSVTHRLVASSALGETPVANVTRFLLSERGALAAVDPMARYIEAPSTDKGAALPAHAGTLAYIDDEEESFLDRYSDFIYLGAMFFGVIASGATAIVSRINARGVRVVERMTGRLLEILHLVRGATTVDALSEFEAETDRIVGAALQSETARSIDERCLGTLGLALDQVREAIRDRRAILDNFAAQPSTQPYPRAIGAE